MNLANKWLLGVTSAAAISGVAYYEGLRQHAYLDVGGVPTVCYGYTGKDIDMHKIYSIAECRTKLVAQIQLHGKGVLDCIKVPIKQEEYDAYTIFAYNVGVSAFCNSRANKLLSQGRHAEACKALATGPDGSPAWSFAGGKYVSGLQGRRIYERNLCLGASK